MVIKVCLYCVDIPIRRNFDEVLEVGCSTLVPDQCKHCIAFIFAELSDKPELKVDQRNENNSSRGHVSGTYADSAGRTYDGVRRHIAEVPVA